MLRQKIGLSQRMFGRLIGRSEGYVSKVESGKIEPTSEIIHTISDVFGVSEEWIRSGAGSIGQVASLGERVKAARRARDYTQAELADEIGCTRNTVGLIERGMVRPGEELFKTLCDRLWLDETWLLTGKGRMDRRELTEFYELLRRDPAVRRHIRHFIDHLDHPYAHYSAEEDPEKEEKEAAGMTLAYVNDIEAAKLFFREYNIPYEQIEVGKDAGKLKVRALRFIDHERMMDIEARCRRLGLAALCDHSNVFRDADGNTIITFSPYDYDEVPKGRTWIEKSEHSIYGYGTTTFVVRWY